jgi:hypothetical protein
MKIRSSLLVACMLVVPLIAMFSHKIPPDLRLSARRHIWDLARKSILHACGGGGAETPVVPSPTTVAVSPAEPAPVDVARVQRAARSLGTRKEIEDRLVELGAFSLECSPGTDAGGLQRCSCRVAADPSGQLQRVFQASEPDPISALHNLLEQVQLWKQRMATAPPAGQPPPAQTRRFQ